MVSLISWSECLTRSQYMADPRQGLPSLSRHFLICYQTCVRHFLTGILSNLVNEIRAASEVNPTPPMIIQIFLRVLVQHTPMTKTGRERSFMQKNFGSVASRKCKATRTPSVRTSLTQKPLTYQTSIRNELGLRSTPSFRVESAR